MGGRVKDLQILPRRLHVVEGSKWGQSAATDYWLNLNTGFDQMAAASTAIGEQLAENGWTATSLVNTAGSGADFGGGLLTGVTNALGTFQIPADMGTPNHILTNASGDLLASPAIFGDYVHMMQASKIVGRRTLPRYLICEVIAAFTVASADETTSALGFFEDGATISTEADQYAVIRSNATNFLGQGNAGAHATGPAVATTWHLWHIAIEYNGATGPNITYYRDGVIFSTTAGVGIQDEAPLKFGLHSLTTNRIGCGLVHIYYDW